MPDKQAVSVAEIIDLLHTKEKEKAWSVLSTYHFFPPVFINLLFLKETDRHIPEIFLFLDMLELFYRFKTEYDEL